MLLLTLGICLPLFCVTSELQQFVDADRLIKYAFEFFFELFPNHAFVGPIKSVKLCTLCIANRRVHEHAQIHFNPPNENPICHLNVNSL
jgi:hypothetical protein